MNVSINTRQAYSEVDEFLQLLSIEKRNKVPQELRELFAREKDINYKKVIVPTNSIKNQNLKEETLGIIALLNLQYWCEDETEKERLKKVYDQKEKEYQKMLKEKFNPDKIFKKKENSIGNEEQQIQCIQMMKYKESFFKRILNKILEALKIKRQK